MWRRCGGGGGGGGGEEGVHGPQGKDRRHQHPAKDPQVDGQPHTQATQGESAQRVLPAGPVGERQRHHDQHQEGNVLRVKERMGVEPGMEEKKQQGDQGQQAAAVQPEDEPAATHAAGHKDQVGQQMAQEEDVPAVVQAQRLLKQQHRQLKGHAVEAIVAFVGGDLGSRTQDIGEGSAGRAALGKLIRSDAVVVQHHHPDAGEQQASHQRQGPEREAPPAGQGARSGGSGCGHRDRLPAARLFVNREAAAGPAPGRPRQPARGPLGCGTPLSCQASDGVKGPPLSLAHRHDRLQREERTGTSRGYPAPG